MMRKYLRQVVGCVLIGSQFGLAHAAGDKGIRQAEPELQKGSPAKAASAPRRPASITRVVLPPAQPQPSAADPGAASGRMGVAQQIGFARDVPQEISGIEKPAQLEWTQIGDRRVAAFSIQSPAAKALRAQLKFANLPDTAVLRFYSPDESSLFELSGAQVKGLAAQDGALWSPVVEGDELVLEIDIAAGGNAEDPSLLMPQVSHLYASAKNGFSLAKAAGTCNLDATCNSAWAESFAVARLIYTEFGFSYLCTGTLLVDSDAASAVPYFLTANHCISSESVANTLQTYWFYRSSACNSGTLGSFVSQFSGASLLVTTAATDSTLLRLKAAPPAGALFAGWSVGGASVSSNVTGLHHPLGDLQKISHGAVTGFRDCITSDAACPTTSSSGNSKFFTVNWSAGVTEGGSSGSGLFLNDGKYLIGQLYGGYSSCSAPSAPDYYGRLDAFYGIGAGSYLGAASHQPLNASFAGSGSGRISGAAGGINCTSACSIPLPENITTTLTAVPNGGSTFTGWSGDCTGTGTCTVTLSQARSVVANFTVPNYSLNVSLTGSGTGTVTSSPSGIDCGATCSASFAQGTTVVLQAVPTGNSSFTGWSGACFGTATTCSLYISGSTSATANFVALVPPSAPTILSSVAGSQQIQLEFQAGSNGGSAILDYTATCTSVTPVTSVSVVGTQSPITVTGLTRGATYSCTVSARNALGSSSASQPVTLMVPKANSSLSLSVSPTSAVAGYTPVIITANVTGDSPTGTVLISSGSTAPCGYMPLVGNTATCIVVYTSAPAAGPSAAYLGDARNNQSPTAYGTYVQVTPQDTTPDDFAFAQQSAVPVSSPRTSNAAQITGINLPVAISVTGGLYSVGCTGTFTSSPGSIQPGQTVCVRHTSAATNASSVTTTLTVGTLSRTFSSTTEGPDIEPSNFAFAQKTNVGMNIPVVSDAYVLEGVNSPVAISVVGGSYSVGCLANFTNANGLLSPGQSICVRHTSAGAANTSTTTTLTLGTGTASFMSTTSSPTVPGTPVIGTAIAGGAKAIVAFTPGSTGGAGVVSYTANCGGVMQAGPGSPIVVNGLATGVSYTCTVTAQNSLGSSQPSSPSNAVVPTQAEVWLISTFAGTGAAIYSQDGALASNSAINQPLGMAFDGAGSLYVAESLRIRKINPAGFTSTFAGPASPAACCGDGGPATQANLGTMPHALAFRPDGRAVIADYSNGRIREVSLAGIISSIVSNAPNASGVAVDAAGNTYYSNQSTHGVLKRTVSGEVFVLAGTGAAGFSNDGGLATSAQLNMPRSLVVNAQGEILVVDSGNRRVRKIVPDGMISTIAGTGLQVSSGDGGAATSANFVNPQGIAIGMEGNLFVADAGGHTIRMIDSNGIITTIAGTGAAGFGGDGGLAINATLNGPKDIAVDAVGNVYVSDTGNHRIRKLYRASTPSVVTINSVVAGTGIATVSFTPNGDGGSPITSFTVTCGTVSQSGTGSPITVTGLQAGPIYTCTVVANNAVGAGPVSQISAPFTVTQQVLVAVALDFNLDGRSDLLWRNAANGAVQGWLMNGLSAMQVAGLLPSGGYTVTHVADLDGNGKADTLIRHADGMTIGWLHDGLNVSSQTTFFAPGSGWSIKHTADLNGDGKADLIVEHTDGRVVGWLMNGLSVTSTATLVPAGTGWSVARTGDLNGDGKADLIWQNTNGTVLAWLMDGLSATQTATFVGAGTGWSVKLVGDFNGDGKADLVWQNTDGTVQAWLMDGTAITQVASFVPAGTGWSPVLAGDIDGDGKADLFWEHTDGRSQTWLMNGLTVTNLAGFVGAGGWKATHLLDLNGDGKKDVLWKHDTGTVQAWLLNGLSITQVASLAGAGSYELVPPRP